MAGIGVYPAAGIAPAGAFGMGYGTGAHAPNEFFVIESSNPKVLGLVDSAMVYVDMLYEMATIS